MKAGTCVAKGITLSGIENGAERSNIKVTVSQNIILKAR